MSSFRFRLATLLRLRESARDQWRRQVADAQRAADILAERRRELEEQLADNRSQSQQFAQPGGVDIDYLLQSHRYQILLSAEARSIGDQQRQVQAEVDRRRQSLVEADRQVRVLEKLRDKQRTEFNQHEAAIDRKLMDELAQRAHPQMGEVFP
jgi:flagellar FliJ protein